MNASNLTSARLSLTPFASRHLTEEYVSWLNCSETNQYSENRHRKTTLENCKEYRDRMVDGGHFFWAIENREENHRHIGNISAYIDPNNQIAELSILIGAITSHGKGYGSEAWETAQNWLLDRKDIRKTHAGTLATNKGMVKIFKKTDMTIEAIRPHHYLYNGEPVDVIYAGKFK